MASPKGRSRRGSVAMDTPAPGTQRLWDHRPSHGLVHLHPSRSAPDLMVGTGQALPRHLAKSGTTAQALNQLWRQQQRREFLRPTEMRPDKGDPAAVSRPTSSLVEPRRPSTGLSMENIDRRADQVLRTLVNDDNGQWGYVQEVQSRYLNRNRNLILDSLKQKATLQDSLGQLRAQAMRDLACSSPGSLQGSASNLGSVASMATRNNSITSQTSTLRGFWSSTSPHYESASQRFFSQEESLPEEEASQLGSMRARAREQQGHEKYAAITQWGTQPVFYIDR